MNDLESSLRDAFAARADAVTVDPHAYDVIVRRRERRRLTRWVTPVGGLAATVAIVGLAASVALPGNVRPQPPAGSDGAPRHALVVRSTGFAIETVLVPANDLDGEPVARFDLGLNSVAAAGDGQTYYGLAPSTDRNKPCNTTLYRLRASGASEVVGQITGSAENLAVTRDGRRAAYTLLPQGANPGFCDTTRLLEPDIQVRDLTTGATRTWEWKPKGEAISTGAGTVSWSPDGRHLAFGTLGGLLGVVDTTVPGRTFSTHTATIPNGAFLDIGGVRCLAGAPAYLPSGELVADVTCVPGGQWEDPRVAVLDPVTLRIGRTLFLSPLGHHAKWLVFDRAGSHAFVGVERMSGRGSSSVALLYRWNGTGEPEPVEQPDRTPIVGIAW